MLRCVWLIDGQGVDRESVKAMTAHAPLTSPFARSRARLLSEYATIIDEVMADIGKPPLSPASRRRQQDDAGAHGGERRGISRDNDPGRHGRERRAQANR